mgnify:FL=1
MWDIINELDLPYDEIAALLIEILSESKDEIDADCRRWLSDNDRCQKCGQELEYQEHKEYHYELDGAPFELHIGAFCPSCDRFNFEEDML